MTYQEDLASSRSSLSLNSFSNSENGSHPSITGSIPYPSISAKFNPFKRIANAEEIAKGVESIPSHWSLTTVQVKSPLRYGWQTEDFIPHSEIARSILHGDDAISKKTGKPYHRYWSGFGGRLGEASQGLLDIDVDGYSAHPLLERLSNGDLPTTVSSTSGKPGRYHLFYQIPDEYRESLKDFTRSTLIEFEGLKTAVDADGKPTELLEFRYNDHQTVLPPSYHPTTGSNKWINSPETTEVAIAPKWLCEYLVSQVDAKKQEAKERIDRVITLKAERKDYSNGNDLVSFLNDEVLQRLSLEQIFNWHGHNFRQFGSTLKGNPPWRESSSGTSFHVWIDKEGLPAWQDKGTGEGGNAIQYRHKLNGGNGHPKGKEWFDNAKQLADEAGLQLPKNDFKPVETEINAEYKKSDYELKVESEQKRLNTLTIKEHWKQLKSEGRFLDENLLEKIPYSGIVALPNPMNVGKSTFVKKLIKKYPDRKVVSITPTIALGKGQAENWGLTWREDAQAQGVSSGLMLANTKRLGLCYPSLHKLSGTEGDERFSNIDNKGLILILDEAEEGLSFLMQSSIANQQGKRAYNIAALKDLLKDAKEQEILVIVADANLKNPAVDYLTKILPDLPVTVITTDYKPERGIATCYDTDFSVFENALKEAVERGERVIIPCDSQEHGEALDKKFTAMGHKVVRCDKTTAGGKDMKAFIADPDKFLADVQPQIVTYTPTLGSGTSIQATQEYADTFQQVKQLQTEEITLEVTENLAKISENWERLTPYFDQRFCYNYHLIPPQFRQLIARYRHPIPTSYWCGKDLPITGCKSPLPSEQLRQAAAHNEGLMEVWETARKETNTDDSIEILKTMLRIAEDAKKGKNPELTLWAEQRARECFFYVDRSKKLIEELKNDGYTVKVVSEELEEGEKLEDSEFGDEVKEIKEEARKELAVSVVNSPIIPEEDFKFLDKKASLSPEERVYVDRYRFEKELPGLLDDLGHEAADFYYHGVLKDKKHWIKALKLFHGYSNQDALKENDLISFDFAVQRFEKSGIAAIQDNLKIKTGFFKFIKECGLFDPKIGVDLNDFEKEYTAKSFKKLLQKFSGKYKAKLKTYFDAVPLKFDSKAISWINKRLAGFGFRLAFSRKDSNDVRYYNLISEIPDWADENIQNSIFKILDAKIASNVDTASIEAPAVNPGDNIQPPVVTAGDLEHTTNIEETNLVVHSETPKVTVFDKAKEILMATFSPHVIAIAKQIKDFGQASAKALEQLTEIDLLAIQEVVMGSKNYIDADDLPEDYEF